MKLGIFGGTFDPPHHGHLILAHAAAEQAGLDQVLLIPAARNPYKNGVCTAGDIRLSMLKAAVQDDLLFVVDERELWRPPPSFTIDTVEDVARDYNGAKLHLIVGADNFSQLNSWRRAADLRRAARIIWLARPGSSFTNETGEMVVNRQIEISATDIRNRVASGRSIRYLVPERVLQIIDAFHLYQTPETTSRT